MSQPQPTYDLMLLLDVESEQEIRDKVVTDAERLITEGGELLGTYDWGVRELAYEINHQDTADYRLFQFHINDVAVLAELDRTLSITDGLLRHRIIKLAPGTPAPPEPGVVADVDADYEPAIER
jgi:small subunit ribosomal protein S6